MAHQQIQRGNNMQPAPQYVHRGVSFHLLCDYFEEHGVARGPELVQRLQEAYQNFEHYRALTDVFSCADLCQRQQSVSNAEGMQLLANTDAKCMIVLSEALRKYHIATLSSGNLLMHMKKSLCHICNEHGKPQYDGVHAADIMIGESICNHITRLRYGKDWVPVFIPNAPCIKRNPVAVQLSCCPLHLCHDHNANWCNNLHTIMTIETESTMHLDELPNAMRHDMRAKRYCKRQKVHA